MILDLRHSIYLLDFVMFYVITVPDEILRPRWQWNFNLLSFEMVILQIYAVLA